MSRSYLLYGSERYALAILRPLQSAIRARGDNAAWFFDGPGGEELRADERWLRTTAQVREFAPRAVLTSSNAVPHFFPGVKTEVFHGFDAGKPRHIYIRGFFDLYCTTGPRDTEAFERRARELGHFTVRQTGWPKLDPFMRMHATPEPPPLRQRPVILYHSTFSPSWSAANVLYETIRRLAQSGRWQWIVTLHPKSDAGTVARYRALESAHLRFATEDNILDLFPQVDMMISDTSSALSEFLLTYKPVVTFRNRRPGPQLIDIDTPEQLLPAIERALSRPVQLMQHIRAYADSIHPYRDGRSSERVLDAVEEFIAAGARNARRKPLNPWRKLKIRKRIGYWGPAKTERTLVDPASMSVWRFTAPRFWAVWLGVAVLRLGILLPFGLQTLIGRGLGRIAWLVARRERRVGEINLRMCLPELTDAERARLLRRHFAALGCAVFDTALSWWAPRSRVLRLTKLEGREHLERALAAGKGAILLSAHFTATEMGARGLGIRTPTAVMYQQLGNALLEMQFRSSIAAKEVRMIRSNNVRELLSALKDNLAIWFAPDQREAARSSIVAPFFDHPAVTNIATSRIARISGAAVLPYFTQRLENGAGYLLRILPPMEGFPSGDAAVDAVQFHRVLEAQVRRCPAQYLWTYKRFKLQGGDGNPYRRGAQLDSHSR